MWPNFFIFDKNFAAIHEIKLVLALNKQIMLDLLFWLMFWLFWLMYDFRYNFIKKNFDANLLFTDIDSLTYKIKSENVYEKKLNTNTCLYLVNISRKFLIQLTKKLSVKWKMNIKEFQSMNLLDWNQKCILFFLKITNNLMQQMV